MGTYGPIIGTERTDWGNVRKIRSPFDQQPVGEVRFGDARTLEAAIALAELTFASFRREPAHRRARWLRTMATGIRRRADALAETICREAGKPIRLARLEVERSADLFALMAEETGRDGGELHAFDRVPEGEERFGIVRRFPLGPVAAITAFNFPLHLGAHKIAAAVAAGNTLVLKPASQTPMSAILLGRIALESGLPEGVLSVVPSDASDAGPLIADERIRLLTFTGSSQVGWILKGQAGRKRVHLELGGNAAAIVEPDVDVDDAARKLALGAFTYAGQLSTSVQRIYVHDRATRRFLDVLIQTAATKVPTGDPAEESVLCGPLIDATNADRVLEWIDQAARAEATLLLEPRREGNVVTPAVVTQAKPELPIVAREVFGPVVVVETYRGFNRAIELAADTAYGLQAAVFTNDVRKLMRAHEQIEAGALIHNDYPSYRIDPMPYGGLKESGFGRGGPRDALRMMTQARLLVVNPRM